MALKINANDLKKLPVHPYSQARPLLKTGDLFFCSGNYLFSKAIQFFTKSPFSHVGIIYKEEDLDRILFLESELLYGVRMAPLSKYVRDNNGKRKPYNGIMLIAEVEGLDPGKLKQVISYGMDELTRPYNNWEIFRILLRTLFKIGRRTRSRRYICSEYVQACFANAGIRFNSVNSVVSPNGLWENSRVNFKFRIL
jgi:hypothetical protein